MRRGCRPGALAGVAALPSRERACPWVPLGACTLGCRCVLSAVHAHDARVGELHDCGGDWIYGGCGTVLGVSFHVGWWIGQKYLGSGCNQLISCITLFPTVGWHFSHSPVMPSVTVLVLFSRPNHNLYTGRNTEENHSLNVPLIRQLRSSQRTVSRRSQVARFSGVGTFKQASSPFASSQC